MENNQQNTAKSVALLAEGVDRNSEHVSNVRGILRVALLTEGVDRNLDKLKLSLK